MCPAGRYPRVHTDSTAMVVATTLLVVLVAVAAGQTADPFLGQITPFPYTFCPTGWHACDGTLLSISQNTALFSLLGYRARAFATIPAQP